MSQTDNIGNPYSPFGGLSMLSTSAEPKKDSGGEFATYTGPGAGISFLNQPFAFYLGIIALLFLLKYFSENPNTPINPAHVHIGGYNVLAVGTVSIFFIVTLKVFLNRYPIMGLTDVINYV
jgi:hypothetical protein